MLKYPNFDRKTGRPQRESRFPVQSGHTTAAAAPGNFLINQPFLNLKRTVSA